MRLLQVALSGLLAAVLVQWALPAFYPVLRRDGTSTSHTNSWIVQKCRVEFREAQLVAEHLAKRIYAAARASQGSIADILVDVVVDSAWADTPRSFRSGITVNTGDFVLLEGGAEEAGKGSVVSGNWNDLNADVALRMVPLVAPWQRSPADSSQDPSSPPLPPATMIPGSHVSPRMAHYVERAASGSSPAWMFVPGSPSTGGEDRLVYALPMQFTQLRGFGGAQTVQALVFTEFDATAVSAFASVPFNEDGELYVRVGAGPLAPLVGKTAGGSSGTTTSAQRRGAGASTLDAVLNVTHCGGGPVSCSSACSARLEPVFSAPGDVGRFEIFVLITRTEREHLRWLVFAVAAVACAVVAICARSFRTGNPRRVEYEQEQMASAVTAAIQDAVIVTDSVGKVLEVNPFARRLFSMAADQEPDFVVDALIDPHDREAFWNHFSAEPSVENETAEFLAHTESQVNFPVEISIGRTVVGGMPIRVLVVRDVAERMKLLDRAMVSERLANSIAADLRRLIYTANAPIIGLDSAGLINDWNVMMAKISGYQQEEVIGRELERIVDRDWAAPLRRVLECALSGIETSNFEFTLTTKNDRHQVRLMLNATTRRDADGNIVGVVCVGQDITEKRRVIEVEAANAAKNRFLSYICHEIRTPLNGLMGMNQLLQETPLVQEQREYVSSMQSCAEQLLCIVNDMLDLQKIEAGKVNLERIAFNVRDVIEDVMDALAPAAFSKGVELGSSVPPTIPTRVFGDPTRLRQVIYNLASNAIKFTHVGHVIIYERLIDRTPTHATFLIEITDTGIGIDEEGLSKLFRDYQQVDETITRKFGGTGMGLAICKELISLMEGQIGARSALGRGSTFWFSLTLELQADEQSRGADEQSRGAVPLILQVPNPPSRVLVAHSDSAVGQVLSEYLNVLAAHHVPGGCAQLAVDVPSAWDRLRIAFRTCSSFSMVVIDESLPDTPEIVSTAKVPGSASIETHGHGGRSAVNAADRGTGLAQRLCSDPRFADTKIVILTLSHKKAGPGRRSDPKASENDRLTSCDFYVAKPVRLTKLVKCLVELFPPRPSPGGNASQDCHGGMLGTASPSQPASPSVAQHVLTHEYPTIAPASECWSGTPSGSPLPMVLTGPDGQRMSESSDGDRAGAGTWSRPRTPACGIVDEVVDEARVAASTASPRRKSDEANTPPPSALNRFKARRRSAPDIGKLQPASPRMFEGMSAVNAPSARPPEAAASPIPEEADGHPARVAHRNVYSPSALALSPRYPPGSNSTAASLDQVGSKWTLRRRPSNASSTHSSGPSPRVLDEDVPGPIFSARAARLAISAPVGGGEGTDELHVLPNNEPARVVVLDHVSTSPLRVKRSQSLVQSPRPQRASAASAQQDPQSRQRAGQQQPTRQAAEGTPKLSADAARVPAAPAAAQAEETVENRKPAILLAEDIPLNQKVFQMMLRKFGLECDIANDGVEAVEKSAAKTYDLIFMDVQMPRMDGCTAVSEIRHREEMAVRRSSSCPTTGSPSPDSASPSSFSCPSRVTIIALTANAMQSDEQRCLSCGMDFVLTKPVKRDDLMTVIERYTGWRRSEADLAPPPPISS